MTTLVLSATGNTGLPTVRALLSQGASVRGATRSPETARLPEGVEVVRFDLRDQRTWNAALSGVDAMYFCLSTELAGELSAPLAFIEQAVARGVKRIVTLSAFRAEYLTYAPHLKIERAVEDSGAQWVHLRPNFFAENLPGMVSPDNAIALPAGKGRTSFISVQDIGAAAAKALLGGYEGEVWTLTGPEAIDHDEAAVLLGEAMNRKIRYVDIPRDTFSATLEQHLGVPAQKANQLADVYGIDVRAGKYAAVFDDFEIKMGRPAMSFRAWAHRNTAASVG